MANEHRARRFARRRHIEKSDFYPQLTRGLAFGGIIGVIGGLIAMRVAGAVFGGGAALLFGLIENLGNV